MVVRLTDVVLAERYRLIEPAPDRGLGEPWRARDLRREDATVLVKFFRAAEGGELPAEALKALRALRLLRHPAVPAVLNQGVHEGRAWVATEDAAGESVGTLLDRARARGERVELATLKALFDGAAEALAAAHAMSAPVLHAALTPGCVLQLTKPTRGASCALLDLGVGPWLGAAVDAPPRSARSLIARAPEVFAGAAVTVVTDVFLLGALFTEMLALPAAQGETMVAVTAARRREDVPEAVWLVLARAVEPEPSRRLQSVAELTRALDRAWTETPPRSEPRASSRSLLETFSTEESAGPSLASPSAPAPAPAPVASARPVFDLPSLPTPPPPAEPNPWATSVLQNRVEVPPVSAPAPAPNPWDSRVLRAEVPFAPPPPVASQDATVFEGASPFTDVSDEAATVYAAPRRGPPAPAARQDETVFAASPSVPVIPSGALPMNEPDGTLVAPSPIGVSPVFVRAPAPVAPPAGPPAFSTAMIVGFVLAALLVALGGFWLAYR